MANRPADSNESIDDKNLFRIDNRDRRVNEEEITKLSLSQTILNPAIDSLSIESPRATKLSLSDTIEKPEVESIRDSDLINEGNSTNKSRISTKGNRDFSTDRISLLSRETDIPAKLKRLLQIESRRFENIDKISTNESVVSDSESSPRINENSSSKEQTKIIPKVGKTKVSESAKPTDSEFRDINIEKISEKNANRPLERIHFSTPEVEQKWRNIVENLRNKRQKLSESADASKTSRVLITDNNTNAMSSVMNLSRKRCFSEISPENQPIAEEKASNSKTKTDDEIIALLGPIPSANSKIFQGLSFVLESVSLDFINPQQLKTMKTNSEAEYLEQWTRRPFVRDRLIEQINAAGGKLYEKFELLPSDKYESTKLIMNIPHITEESLLCLSVGIETYSHQWIIRCCQEDKIVNPAEERLPAGWSMTKQSYVEMYQRPSEKPFLSDIPFVVVIPMYPPKNKFVSFWERIIGNSGGAVLLVEKPEDEFMEGTVVLTHHPIPMWVIQKAKLYDIPLVTTRWAVQCLIEGQICDYDAHPSFEYNAIS